MLEIPSVNRLVTVMILSVLPNMGGWSYLWHCLSSPFRVQNSECGWAC